MAVVMVPTEDVDPSGLEPDELLDSLEQLDAVRWGLV
jgi:hypothetical protein